MTHPPAFSAFARPRLPKAVPVRRLVEWAFGVEHARLDLPDRRAPEDRGFGFGTEHVLIERARVGCQVDGGRGGFEVPVHWDAECVAARLACLPPAYGGLGLALWVVQHARAGTVPDWMPGAKPRCEPAAWVTNRHGTHPKTEIVRVTYTERRGVKVPTEWRCTPVTFTPHPRQIETARADYTRWRAALAWLLADLRAQPLRDHSLTDDLPPETPWRDE
jgi:hypothetical protein